MKNLNQQPVFISERAGKYYQKMCRCQQVYIYVKKWFSVLSVTTKYNQIPSSAFPDMYVFWESKVNTWNFRPEKNIYVFNLIYLT